MGRAIQSPLLIIALLACCADSGYALAQNASTPLRGQLLQSSPQLVGSFSADDLIAKVTDGSISQSLLRHLFSPVCSVDVYHLEYQTVGGAGEPATASAALMIPVGADAQCEDPHPIILYAHGTQGSQSFDISNLSTSASFEGLLLAIAGATHGYIVVAPNYAGYDTSSLSYHPYLNGDQQAADMMDSLVAARTALAALQTAQNGQLFISGYSEGGYVALATQRAMQAAGISVTASAPMSGPYALSASGDAAFLGQVEADATEQFLLLASSYQHAYGNLYVTPTDMLEPRYAPSIGSLPTKVGTSILVAEGVLPSSGAVFSSTPPTPQLASITPAKTPSSLAAVFAKGFGTDYLISNAYRLSYLEDQAAAPDGGFPNTTTAEPPATPTNGLRIDLKRNDLRSFAPTAPLLLCGGHEDPEVFYLNTQLMQSYWSLTAPESPVTILDVDSSPYPGDPYDSVKTGFAAVKLSIELSAVVSGLFDKLFGGSSQSAQSAVLDQYHSLLVPTFCVLAVKSFFDGVSRASPP